MAIPNDFVECWLEHTKEFESPTSFWRWSSYALIAAILRNNVYYAYKGVRVYPNIYVITLADSARFRKGQPFSLVKKMLDKVRQTKVFAGTGSIQGIIEALANAQPNSKGAPINGGSGLLLAEEFAAFFVDDPRLLPLLCKIYDYDANFPYTLRGSQIVVKDLCVTLYAASNETFLREIYTKRAIYGGLLRRTLLIKPDEVRVANSLMDLGVDAIQAKKDKDLSEFQEKDLIDKLLLITKLKGECVPDVAARTFYDRWYKNVYDSYGKITNSTGLIEGVHTLALKIAIVLAASQQSLIITKEIMEEAIEQVLSLKSNYEGFSRSAGAATNAVIQVQVLDYLYKQPDHKVSREDLLFRFWHEVDMKDLEDFLLKIQTAQLIEIEHILGGKLYYKCTQKCLDMFDKHSKNGTPTP